MPKITRYQGNLKAFASEQLGTERTLFGELTFADDLTSQFTPDFLRGWGIVSPSDQPSLNDFNAAMYTNGMLSAYLHQMGVAEYNAEQEYYVDSITTSGGALYISLVNANTGNDPATSPAQWRAFLTSVPGATTTVKGIVELATTAEAIAGLSATLAVAPAGLAAAIAASSTDTLNKPAATLPAAGTINLTAGAPGTSQVEITGTGVNINGFTVAANRFFIVKITGASNTLVNSASLVTGRGANIPVVAGDSFLMRSTAANTVEILSGSFLIDRSIGSGQSWQNVAASRSLGTNFTNITGRSISVSIGMVGSGTPVFELIVDGRVASYSQTPGGPVNLNTLEAIIPNLSVYSVQLRSGTFSSIRSWEELRS